LDSNITVAILNWNGVHHLQTYLPSVVAHSGEARIRVIDNASTDQSVNWIRNHFPGVDISVFEKNLGFTGGYNKALKEINTEFTVLLNSDIEVSAGWLDPMVDFLIQHPKVAAVQPKILSWGSKEKFEYAGACGGFMDLFGYPFCRGRIFDLCEDDLGQYNEPRPVFWASGASLLIRTKLFLENEGFEERFFAHMEEIDLCWRLWNRGHEIWVVPDSVVYHLGAGTLLKTSPKKTFLNYRNGIATLFMNSSANELWWKLPIRLVLDGLAGIRYVANGEILNCIAISKAHVAFYKDLPYWIKKRRFSLKQQTQNPPDFVFWNRSILPSYFLFGRQKFSELKFPGFKK